MTEFFDNTTHCARCKSAFYTHFFWDQEKTQPMDYGYAESHEGIRICYECMALEDLKQMRETGKIRLYLVEEYPDVPMTINGYKRPDRYVTNYPGTLKIRVPQYKKGHHNIARTRIDIWFSLDGFEWHGVQYGDWNTVVHCKRTKQIRPGYHGVVLPESETLAYKRAHENN